MIRHGILKSWDSTNWKADVLLTGSITTLMSAIPVNRGIASGDMVVGRNVLVAQTEPSNRASAVVIAVWT